MCTLVILRRPDHHWPVLIGANRDEMIGRASKPPGRHWPDRPELVAGFDLLAGGSWLGRSPAIHAFARGIATTALRIAKPAGRSPTGGWSSAALGRSRSAGAAPSRARSRP